MNRNKVTELLKLYPSYKYAVKSFETTGWVAISGTGYSDMPRNGSFGTRAPVKFTADSYLDCMDYREYKRVVEAIEGALETLHENERRVIELKWLKGHTLSDIDSMIHVGIGYSKQIHRKALAKLSICLTFVELPHIEKIAVNI